MSDNLPATRRVHSFLWFNDFAGFRLSKYASVQSLVGMFFYQLSPALGRVVRIPSLASSMLFAVHDMSGWLLARLQRC
jgi:hypothetical protein